MAVYTAGCRRAGQWLVKNDVPRHSDAMVILMGDFPDRVLQAADLWSERKADRVIIVEESMGPFEKLEARGARILSNSRQAADALVALGVPHDSISIIPGDARSTLDEALAVSKYLSEADDADTLLLVSSADHMRRASMIFRYVLRHSELPAYIGCSPSAYSNFDAKHWWRDKEGIQYVLTEYLKIGSFVLVEKSNI